MEQLKIEIEEEQEKAKEKVFPSAFVTFNSRVAQVGLVWGSGARERGTHMPPRRVRESGPSTPACHRMFPRMPPPLPGAEQGPNLALDR